MISGTHTIQINATTETVWAYLADFSNWAPYVVGFQGLRTVDDQNSVWTLRGDVGVLSREVDLEVRVLEWAPGHRASFSINGLTERLEGTGAFELVEVGADDAASAATTAEESGTTPAVEPKRSWWQRFTHRMAMRALRNARTRGARVAGAESTPAADEARPPRVENTSDRQCALTFTLDVSPGGPMAPMVEMLMRPLLEPAAEDLSTQIREQIEGAARV